MYQQFNNHLYFNLFFNAAYAAHVYLRQLNGSSFKITNCYLISSLHG